MRKRMQYIFENVIEVQEYHDGRYGAPGKPRMKKKKATREQMEKVNQWNKEKKARHKLRMYFEVGKDWFLTLTCRREARPPDYKTFLTWNQKFLREIRKEFKKRGVELRWIRNIECTKTGNWHTHMVIKDLPGVNMLQIMSKAWPYGKVKDPQILYERGELGDLAAYITKDEKTKKECVPAGMIDHSITEAHYRASQNMPLPPPKVDVLKTWPKEIKPKEGFYIDPNTVFEGINPVTGYPYRHYTMIRVKRRE